MVMPPNTATNAPETRTIPARATSNHRAPMRWPPTSSVPARTTNPCTPFISFAWATTIRWIAPAGGTLRAIGGQRQRRIGRTGHDGEQEERAGYHRTLHGGGTGRLL